MRKTVMVILHFIEVAPFGTPELVNRLLRAEAKVNVQNLKGRAANHEVAHFGSLPTLEALLEAGADPLLPDKEGKIPLHFASYLENPDKIKLLSSIIGSDGVNTQDNDGNAPLHIAVRNGSERAVACTFRSWC